MICAKDYHVSRSLPTSGRSGAAWQALIDLHPGYETCEPWPLTVTEPDNPDDAGFYRIDGRMRWDRDPEQRPETGRQPKCAARERSMPYRGDTRRCPPVQRQR